MSAIRVLLADDHAIVRSGLRLLLEREPDITVTGEAAESGAVDHRLGMFDPDPD